LNAASAVTHYAANDVNKDGWYAGTVSWKSIMHAWISIECNLRHLSVGIWIHRYHHLRYRCVLPISWLEGSWLSPIRPDYFRLSVEARSLLLLLSHILILKHSSIWSGQAA
jgi:hypothetical protein